MDGQLSGKIAIVTGAGKGIGAGIARVFSADGATVLVADYNEQAGMKTVAAIKDAGREASFVKVDVSKKADTEQMARVAIERYGRIDILCNNAGIYDQPAFIDEMTEEQWDHTIGINLKGVFFTVKAVLPQMIKQRYGRIVITSSITGPRTAILKQVHYAASKSGVNGFIRNAAIEMASRGITINGVEPGNIITDGTYEFSGGDPYIKANERTIPMGRMGKPEDIGYAMSFLASDRAAYITGQTIIVDGGQILPESVNDMHREP